MDLPEEHADQFPIEFLIGLITHGKIHPGFLVNDALVMGEGVKSGLSVVSSHAAFAKAAKAHFAGGQVDDSVIDAAAAKAAAGSNLTDRRLIGGKQIEGQRMGS